jgi:hypothetical protein
MARMIASLSARDMAAPHKTFGNALSSPPGALSVALGLSAFLHLPAFRYDLISDDEAIYDAMAQVVVRGGVMYRDTVDHKPPGLVYTYGAVRHLVGSLGGTFSQVMAGVHLLGLLFAAATAAVLYGIALYLLGKRLAWIPPVLYALVSTSNQPPDGLAVNGEMLMNLPTALGVWCALTASRRAGFRRALFDVLAGAMCGVAALYKYQAALVGLSFLASIGIDDLRRPGRRVAGIVGRVASLAFGLTLPFAAAGLYFWKRGALGDAFFWGIEFNRHYLAEGPDAWTSLKRFSMQFFGVIVPSCAVYGAGLYGLWSLLKRRASAADARMRDEVAGVIDGRAMLVVWTAESLACVTLGRRFFGHYFLQPELPLALLAAGPIARLWQERPRLVAAGIAVPALGFFLASAVPEVTHKWFYALDPDYGAVGRAAAAETAPSESIWVWGNVPQIYYAAERVPGVRFTFCNYLTGLSPGTRSEFDPTVDPKASAITSAWPLVIKDLEQRRPTLLLDTAAADMKFYGKFPISSFPPLERYIGAHYHAERDVNGVVFYRRVGPT